MSGGSYNYIYNRLLDECKGRMYDDEMEDLIIDLCNVLHELEWWQSSDCDEESYRKAVKEFKEKWFGNISRQKRLKEYIEKQCGVFKEGLLRLVGEDE